jgi:HD-like signal output (HDOD) protein
MPASISSANHRPPTLDAVCESALRLPCSPALLPRLIAVLESPDSSADQIAELIKLDSALAVSTLRLANSAFFSGGGGTDTVADAVMRLGQRELFRLAALALVSRWEPVSDHTEPGNFSRHALCTALAAEVLAERTEQIDPSSAYTAGLVCDLGKLVIVHACARFFPAIRDHTSGGATWSQAEVAVLGYTHAEVGGRLLRRWKFPASLVLAAEFCEKPALAPVHVHALIAHVHAAKYIATSLGAGVAEGGFLFEVNSTFLLKHGFTPGIMEETRPVVHDRAKTRLQDGLTNGLIVL